MKIKISEKDVVRQVIDYLTIKHYLFIRNNTGAFKTESGGFYRFGSVGSPDILVFHKNDFYGIECKSSIGKQSPAQKEFQEKFDNAGGIYLLIKSLEELKDYL